MQEDLKTFIENVMIFSNIIGEAEKGLLKNGEVILKLDDVNARDFKTKCLEIHLFRDDFAKLFPEIKKKAEIVMLELKKQHIDDRIKELKDV